MNRNKKHIANNAPWTGYEPNIVAPNTGYDFYPYIVFIMVYFTNIDYHVFDL